VPLGRLSKSSSENLFFAKHIHNEINDLRGATTETARAAAEPG
jgi:hypothetical protein